MVATMQLAHLFRRQEPSDRVVHEVKLQARVGLTVSERVELHETLDATVKYPTAALHVDVLR